MTPYNDDEGKATLGCIAIAVVVLIILAFVRYFVLTPTGWGF